MDRVVYLLGAGFSAPLGLPVMSNFRMRSQDMYFGDPERYGYFKEVFETIVKLSNIMNYYSADLYNIEEILSVLDMGEYLEGRRLRDEFIRYIQDVIKHFTPSLPTYNLAQSSNWYDFLFSDEKGTRLSVDWKLYGTFVANLLRLKFHALGGVARYSDVEVDVNQDSKVRYDVVTLNYDRILEIVAAFVNDSYAARRPVSFATDVEASQEAAAHLAKLHGSVDTSVIVPPTWSKGVNTDVTPAWKMAFQLLSEATHLRIVGYSLPIADAYVKYLLKSAVGSNYQLKELDVICKDGSGDVQKRYNEFIRFNYFRFLNADTRDYLVGLSSVQYNTWRPGAGEWLIYDKLEEAHAQFMK
jgi:hypothetical protein